MDKTQKMTQEMKTCPWTNKGMMLAMWVEQRKIKHQEKLRQHIDDLTQFEDNKHKAFILNLDSLCAKTELKNKLTLTQWQEWPIGIVSQDQEHAAPLKETH